MTCTINLYLMLVRSKVNVSKKMILYLLSVLSNIEYAIHEHIYGDHNLILRLLESYFIAFMSRSYDSEHR